MSFVLVVVTALRQRGSWLAALLLAPLLLSYGLHTFVWSDPGKVAGILWLPMPVGPPAAGLRASLAQIYWPSVESVGSRLTALPDVWKPAFPLGYAMTFVVLAHASRSRRATWIGSLTLAGLVGFLGLPGDDTRAGGRCFVGRPGCLAARPSPRRRRGEIGTEVGRGAGGGGAAASVWWGCSLRDSGWRRGLVRPGLDRQPWRQPLAAARRLRRTPRRRRPAEPGTIGGRGRRDGAGAPRPAGAGSGGGGRSAGAGLAGARLSAAPPGPWPLGGTRS